MPHSKEVIHTKIWQEDTEDDNPFAAKRCFCSGYDVYGNLLGKISWIEYLYLLYVLEPPTSEQSKLPEGIVVIPANPGQSRTLGIILKEPLHKSQNLRQSHRATNRACRNETEQLFRPGISD